MTMKPVTIAQRLETQTRRLKIKKLLDIAQKYGVVKKGWTAADYMREAVKNYGWESTAITGPKGSAQSNLLMPRGFSIYEKWDEGQLFRKTARDNSMDLVEKAL